MKTISGFIILVIMFCMSFRLSAEPSPYTVSLAVSAGALVGQSEEIVYKLSNSDTYLSQLLWDMKPLAYIGTEFAISRKKPLEKWGVFSTISLKFGIPMETGVMEDRDWDSPDNRLTNFSSHDNYTQKAFLCDISPIGVSFPIVSSVLIRVYPVFSYMYFSWASRDGYLQYERYDWETMPVSGPMINYSQSWMLASQGIGLWVPFLKVLSAGIDFQIGSVLSCTALDEHISRNVRFKDRISGGCFFEAKGVFTFSPISWLDITLSAGGRYITGSRGVSYMNDDPTPVSGAGAGYSVADIGLSVKARF
ncbi:MAG: omptin family outer membrane protease [Spirochaetaceae bacterium]|jgi:outer membrane protease|nr:omptin family outer membrane protease [Spirochaetaceae bacterium]